jgi:hypothetical protein
MATIHQRKFLSSHIFKEHYTNCMSFESGIKGNPWAKEVLIKKCNEFIQNFISDAKTKNFKNFFYSTISK